MTETLGTITAIEEINGATFASLPDARLGLSEMISTLFGSGRSMDGYRVTTDQHVFHVLISNYQNCCESWGYLSSDDDLAAYVGSTLNAVNLTDTALNTQVVEDSEYYDDDGGIQFVDFVTDRGTFQLAVYNAHNGYYGHSILVLKDDEALLSDVL